LPKTVFQSDEEEEVVANDMRHTARRQEAYMVVGGAPWVGRSFEFVVVT
jgi:hypothetical protein